MSSLVISGDTSGTVTLSAPAVAGSTTITVPATTGTMVVLPTTPSMVRLNTANGYGSTNTAIRRFTNAVVNQGSDITYADSAANGASFTINTAGIYAITYGDSSSTTTSWNGLSLNSAQLTTAITSITISTVLSIAYSGGANGGGVTQWTGYLAVGDVVRPHTASVTVGSVANTCNFTIIKIG